MFRFHGKSCLALTTMVCLFFSIPLTSAQSSMEPQIPERSGGAMVADIFLLRPAGLIATAFGLAAFIISLPFSLPTGTTGTAAQKLIVDPAKYTFVRPLGDLQDTRDSLGPMR